MPAATDRIGQWYDDGLDEAEGALAEGRLEDLRLILEELERHLLAGTGTRDRVAVRSISLQSRQESADEGSRNAGLEPEWTRPGVPGTAPRSPVSRAQTEARIRRVQGLLDLCETARARTAGELEAARVQQRFGAGAGPVREGAWLNRRA